MVRSKASVAHSWGTLAAESTVGSLTLNSHIPEVLEEEKLYMCQWCS